MSSTFLSTGSRRRTRLAATITGVSLITASIIAGAVSTPGQILALPGASESTLVTVEPTRVLDTRHNIGLTGPFQSTVSRTLKITGTIATYIEATPTTAAVTTNKEVLPTGATGVIMNVTAVSPTSNGFLSIRPGTATGVPATAGLNFAPGDVVPNAVTVALPTGPLNNGDIDIHYGGPAGNTMHVIIDIVGYTTSNGLADLTARLVALETAGVKGDPGTPGTPGTPGAKGDDGATGPAGPVNRISDAQIATLRWDQDPGRAATITVGDNPFGVAFDGTNIWVTNTGSNDVSKIDPATNTVTATIPVGTTPYGVAFDGTNIWVTNYGANTVSKIDPATNTLTALIPVRIQPHGVAFDGTNIWVTNYGAKTVSKIDPATNTVTALIPAGTNPVGVAFDGTNIWVTNTGSNDVTKIDPATNTVTARIPVGIRPHGVAFDGTNIWVTNADSHDVSKIDPAADTVTATVPVGFWPEGVAFDGTNIWVTNVIDQTVSKIDPASNTVTATIPVSAEPRGVAFDGTNIWVTNDRSNTMSKLLPG